MADFVQSANARSATRTLAEPITGVATFNMIVQSVITDNPFEYVAYMTAGESHSRSRRPRRHTPPSSSIRTPKPGLSGPAATSSTLWQSSMCRRSSDPRQEKMLYLRSGVTALLAAAAVSTAHGGTVVSVSRSPQERTTFTPGPAKRSGGG